MAARKPLTGLTASIAAIFVASQATAQDFVEPEKCELEINADQAIDWRGLYGQGYEVFEPAEYYEPVMVEIRHTGPPCQFFLTASSSDNSGAPALNGSDGVLLFDLRREPSGPSIFSADFLGDQLSRLSGQFGGGVQTISSVLYLAIPPGQTVSGGSYFGQPVLRVFREDIDGPDLVDEATIDIIAPVPSVLGVELVEAGLGVRTFDVDLGSLSRAVERTIYFEVRSNAQITASFNSQNNGLLKHFAGAPGIPYRLLFENRTVELNGQPSNIAINDTRLHYRPLPLSISVEGSANAAAGSYSDILTVTFVVD